MWDFDFWWTYIYGWRRNESTPPGWDVAYPGEYSSYVLCRRGGCDSTWYLYPCSWRLSVINSSFIADLWRWYSYNAQNMWTLAWWVKQLFRDMNQQQTFHWSFFFTGPWQRGVGRDMCWWFANHSYWKNFPARQKLSGFLMESKPPKTYLTGK